MAPEPGLESAQGSDVAVALGSGTGAAVMAVDVALGSGADAGPESDVADALGRTSRSAWRA